jgi:hypothetical protein
MIVSQQDAKAYLVTSKFGQNRARYLKSCSSAQLRSQAPSPSSLWGASEKYLRRPFVHRSLTDESVLSDVVRPIRVCNSSCVQPRKTKPC